MKKLLFVAVLLVGSGVYSTCALAQTDAGLLYLMIKPGARAAGSGEAFVATADDATATYYNPAGLAFQTGKALSMSHTKWLPALANDLYHEFLAYSWHQEGLGHLGMYIIYMSYGQQVRMSETAEFLGTFRSFDTALGLSYGARLSDRSSVGVTIKILHSRLSPKGTAAEKGPGSGTSCAVDLGYLHRDLFTQGFSFGVNLQNVGPSITYIDAGQADPLPQNLKVGFAYQIFQSEFNSLKLSADFSKLLVRRTKDNKTDPFYKALVTSWTDKKLKTEINEVITNVGLEYWYGSWVSLRTGLNRDTYFGEGKAYVTFGAGLKYRMLQFDMAYMPAPKTPLANNTRFSLTVRL